MERVRKNLPITVLRRGKYGHTKYRVNSRILDIMGILCNSINYFVPKGSS